MQELLGASTNIPNFGLLRTFHISRLLPFHEKLQLCTAYLYCTEYNPSVMELEHFDSIDLSTLFLWCSLPNPFLATVWSSTTWGEEQGYFPKNRAVWSQPKFKWIPCTPREDARVLKMRNECYSWDSIHAAFSHQSVRSIQVHYCTKLKDNTWVDRE